MRLTKQPRSPYWYVAIQIDGHRYFRSTGETAKRAAERRAPEILAAIRAEAAGTALDRMTITEALSRWYEERGQWRQRPRAVLRLLLRFRQHFGAHKPLTALDDAALAQWVSQRRAAIVRWGGQARPISNARVNREMQTLRAVWRRARDVWRAEVAPVNWTAHMLTEPRERVRCLTAEQQAALRAALRPDLRDAMDFAVLTGLRQGEQLGLIWGDIDLGAMVMRVPRKGGAPGETETVPITPAVLEVLGRQAGRHPDAVWTFQPHDRASPPRPKADAAPRPLTPAALRGPWKAAVAAAGLGDFRWHDLRHTAGTRLLAAGNLRLAQKLLRHANPATTAKYAHALDDDLRAAMEAASAHTNDSTNDSTATARDEKHQQKQKLKGL